MKKWLGDNPFHTLLLLTEKPRQWPTWLTALLPLALAAAAGLIWTRSLGNPALGWAVALGLGAFVLADWVLLAALPRRGVSFGPAQPPLLALALFRWLLLLAALPLAGRWPATTLASLLVVQVLLWAFVAYGLLVEPFRLQVTRLEIPSAKLSNPGTPLRIVQLSDLHIERLTRRERALPALVTGLDPDLVVLTGDFLNTSYNDDARALVELEALLAQIDAPGGVYAIWGTTEVDHAHLLRPLLTGLGIVVLEDRAVQVAVRGQRLWLMGLLCSRGLEAGAEKLGALLAQSPPGAFNLLLYHTPDLMPRAAALGVDLFLAGHTHGGQWRVPGWGAILTSSCYWKRYEAGPYCQEGTHLYVSRGLGLEGFGAPRARFFCPPEVVAITLTGEAEPS